MTTVETWRVVCEGGEVREVTACKRRADWIPSVDGPEYLADVAVGQFAYGSSLRIAVANLAIESRWPVVEIVAPGAQTSDERLAQAIAERDAAEADRDYWHAQATGMAPSVDGMRAITSLLIPGGTGCVVDPERAVAAVDALRAIVDGRTAAPTDAERAVHAGEWLVRYRDSRACRWWPLDSTGRPCAWPTGGGL